ncbi:MAG: Pyrimidine reductase, riboflavin biosynthesis [Roseibaca calidilacus]|uniref:Pyrimidine reductase, riboflavin biosynthesis n=1 Tax=Roseibaca calidilacus TaxID=1666912 RepID=A0A0P7W8N2_9RHOB|nr:RibD family protein [Roseibaca calidilacus]KPP93532.1 MAG: Pyrimidine reductase, riboflavin biosynthesis [Roseibaca calidilacus]CUX80499.1 riboflavin-specific deaminase C-terminal domain-containing protein [Roseibaca calidilacus]
MDKADVTPRVWQRILDIRAGKGCACCGDWTDGEQTALNIYAPLARRDMGPIAIGQIGQSLDGRVATVSGDARDISGPDGLRHLHRLRALVDAVVIGVRTALHDNPRLTVRLCPGQNPARVIIDPRGRLPDDAPALRDDGARRIVVQTVARARPEGVEIVRLPSLTDGTLAPRQILSALLEFGLNAVLVEGGGITVSRFFEAGLLSHLHVAVAPLLIGGGPQGFNRITQVGSLADAPRPDTQVCDMGSDILFNCALTDAARERCENWHQTDIADRTARRF